MRCIKNAFWEKLLPYLFAPCWITGRDAVRSRPVENVHTFQTAQASWRCRQGRSTKETIVVMRVVAFEWYTKYNCVLLYRCADLITHLSLIIPIPTAVFCTWCTPLPSIQMQDQISPALKTCKLLWRYYGKSEEKHHFSFYGKCKSKIYPCPHGIYILLPDLHLISKPKTFELIWDRQIIF